MAVGVEKLKDSGFSGLLRADPPSDGTAPELRHLKAKLGTQPPERGRERL